MLYLFDFKIEEILVCISCLILNLLTRCLYDSLLKFKSIGKPN